MDNSGWPEGLILIGSLLLTVLLARLGSIGSVLSRSTLERFSDDGVSRARLLLSMYRPRYVLGQMVTFGQTVSIAVGGLAFIELTKPLLQPVPLPILGAGLTAAVGGVAASDVGGDALDDALIMQPPATKPVYQQDEPLRPGVTPAQEVLRPEGPEAGNLGRAH
mgnify:CR=1 FL=1